VRSPPELELEPPPPPEDPDEPEDPDDELPLELLLEADPASPPAVYPRPLTTCPCVDDDDPLSGGRTITIGPPPARYHPS